MGWRDAPVVGEEAPKAKPAAWAAAPVVEEERPPVPLGRKAMNMISRGAWAGPGALGLDSETVQAAWQAVDLPGGEKMPGTFGERFEKAKAAQLGLSKQVDKESPIASGVVRGLAAVPTEALAWASAPAVKVAQAASFIPKALAYGPRLGALAAGSEYGSTAHAPPGERLAGAAAAGTVGTLFGGVGAGLLPNPAVMAPVRSAAERLRGTAIEQGRKVLTGNAAPMATKKPLSDEAVRAAYDAKAIRPFGTVEKAAERLWTAREALGDDYARIVADLEAKGVTGPDAVRLAKALRAEAAQMSSDTLETMDPGPGLFRDTAEEIASKVQEAAPRPKHGGHGKPAPALLVDPFGRDLPSAPVAPRDPTLKLTQAENMKRTSQRAARADYVREGPQSLAGEARTAVASRLRRSVEEAIESQADKAPAEAAAFVPVKRRLGPVIEASDAANRASARAANRQTHGLGAKVMAGGALAGGGVPEAAAALYGATALRNRGPATLGWTADSLARLLEIMAAPGKPMTMTPEAAALVAALRPPNRMPVALPVGAAEDR